MERTPQDTSDDVDAARIDEIDAPEETSTDTRDTTTQDADTNASDDDTATIPVAEDSDTEPEDDGGLAAEGDHATEPDEDGDADPGEDRRIGSVPSTGPIPVVGEAVPVTGAVPVIRPIYPPKKRLPWIVSTVILALLLIGGAYLGWRMYEVNTEWQDYSAQLEEANYALGQQIADEQATVVEKQAEIDLLSEQLSTSNTRVLELADEKASAVDGQEFNEQLIEGLNETLVLGQTATASLNSCIDGLEQLNTYLAAPEDEYDADEVQDYADGVAELCAASDQATANFQSALASE